MSCIIPKDEIQFGVSPDNLTLRGTTNRAARLFEVDVVRCGPVNPVTLRF